MRTGGKKILNSEKILGRNCNQQQQLTKEITKVWFKFDY